MNSIMIPEQGSNVACTYDKEADVLYLTLGEPSLAVGIDIGDGLVLRVDEDRNEVVGLTVIGLHRRMAEQEAA